MTLSRFLRDYLYIPLGGSRQGTARYVNATLITMGLCGLWHGAGLTFVVWGLAAWRRADRLPVLGAKRPPARYASRLDPDHADRHRGLGALPCARFRYGGRDACRHGGRERYRPGEVTWPAVLAAAAAVSIIGPTTKEFVEEWLRPLPVYGVAFALAAVLVVLEVGQGQPKSFIYFQF